MMGQRRAVTGGVMVGIALVACSIATAETIHLKNGNTVEGAVVREEGGRVTVDIPGLGQMEFTREEIASITASPAPSVPAPTSPPPDTETAPAAEEISPASSGDTKKSAAVMSALRCRLTGGTSPTIQALELSITEHLDRYEFHEVMTPRPGASAQYQPRDVRVQLKKTEQQRQGYHQMWDLIAKGADVWRLKGQEGCPPNEITYQLTFSRHGKTNVVTECQTTLKGTPLEEVVKLIMATVANAQAAQQQRDAQQRRGSRP